jgi:hypothetical protein
MCEHHVAEHGDEAPVRVEGEAPLPVASASPSAMTSLSPRFRIVSIMPGIDARAPERARDLRGQLPLGDVLRAHLGREREAWRHREPDPSHLGEARPFSTEQILARRIPFRLTIPERVDVLCHGASL